jgi:chitin synthase
LSGKSIEEVDKPQVDIDSQFEKITKLALMSFAEQLEEEERSLDDSYKIFRTKLVLLWTFSNAILAICITSIHR